MNLVFTSGTEKFVKKRSGVMRYNTDAEVNPAAPAVFAQGLEKFELKTVMEINLVFRVQKSV